MPSDRVTDPVLHGREEAGSERTPHAASVQAQDTKSVGVIFSSRHVHIWIRSLPFRIGSFMVGSTPLPSHSPVACHIS